MGHPDSKFSRRWLVRKKHGGGAVLAIGYAAELGPRWSKLRSRWGHDKAMIRPSWDILGPSWGQVGPRWGRVGFKM
eukprot:12427900-Karenia_brevis.AAC.1